MKLAERIVMVLIVLAFVVGGSWLYLSVQNTQAEKRAAVARGEYEIPIKGVIEDDQSNYESTKSNQIDDWRKLYPVTVKMLVGSTTVEASVADTVAARVKGLSGTPYLPDNVVKLFAFGADGEHAIWMKDMNYALDILWVTKEGEIVHIEENVAPETYPESFASPIPAWYVIEANAGFAASNTIAVGDRVVLQ